MSKMTSSIHTADTLTKRRLQAAAAAAANAKQQQMQQPLDSNQTRQSCNGATKTLTDFSIDSIIGRTRLRERDQVSRAHTDERRADDKLGPTLAAPERPSSARQDTKTIENGSTDSRPENFISLQNSMSKRERPKHFQCVWCPLKFSNNGQLRNHERIHTGERPFRCDRADCGRTFTRNEELTRHKLIHSGMRPHVCRHCEKRFGRKDHLKKHERTHERKKSSRRSQASRAAANHHQARHELDMFLPLKLNHISRNPSLSVESCYRIPSTIISTANQPDLLYTAQSQLSLNTAPNDLITSQIVSLARAATTNTATPSIPIMGASLATTQAIMNSASNAMQQLATNYLHSWFNVIGQQG